MAKIAFTADRVSGFKCPPDKTQAFLWDATTPGLGLRTTPAGKPSYVFQGLLDGKTIRVTIGSPAIWGISKARAKVREMQHLIDEGKDPREVKRQAAAEREQRQAAAQAQERAQSLTVCEAWHTYLQERRAHWGERHYQDHVVLARAGGQPAQRGTRGRGVTQPGPLHPLMGLALVELTPAAVESWASTQGKARPTSARLAWRLLRAFLSWCSEHPELGPIVGNINAAKTRRAREALGKAGTKDDALLREQLPGWFAAVRSIGNPAIAAYLQTLLLIGARPGEVLELRWEDINTQWRGLTIRDKVEGTRVIPLTPYVWHLLNALPRRGEYVFASTSKPTQPIAKPHAAHATACKVAGIEHLTFHGLRRSFKSLTEWLEVPAGVVAQIMGHKPSATAEKHYTVRPLDLLRQHHARIEAWILEQAEVPFDAQAEPGKLRVVNG